MAVSGPAHKYTRVQRPLFGRSGRRFVSMAMPDALAGCGNCCLADQDRAGLRYCPARHLGQPGPGQCLPDRVYLTGARTLPAPAAGARAASGPAGLAGLEAEAPSPVT